MGMLPEEQWEQLRSLPDWQDRLYAALEAWPEATLVHLTVGITAGAMNYWQKQGLLDQPGWWEMMRLRCARAGAWDLTRDQVSRSWLKEQMFRWLAENLDFDEAVARSTGELARLIDLQGAPVGSEGQHSHQDAVTLTASQLEDLLDLAAARQRLEDADEDDWVSWEEIEAGLKA